MSLLDDVKDTVTNTLQNELKSVKVLRESGTYNVVSGTSSTSTLTFSGEGFSQSVSEEYMELSTVSSDDREIVILQSTLTNTSGVEKIPKTGDRVKLDSNTFDVVAVDEGPSSTLWTVVGTK